MMIEQIKKGPTLKGSIELPPDYAAMCSALLDRRRENPLVSRAEIDGLLGERGKLELLLEEFVTKGYLLHGSQNKAQELEPRQAKDDAQTPENQLHALYATDIPAIALNISIVSEKKVRDQQKSIHWGGGVTIENDQRKPVFTADQDLASVLDDGYVYILQGTGFLPTNPGDRTNYQFVSYDARRPVLIIPTSPSDFEHEVVISAT